ncbi:MAG: hypothetical protein WCD37_14440 [Chloroflexia bacterium]
MADNNQNDNTPPPPPPPPPPPQVNESLLDWVRKGNYPPEGETPERWIVTRVMPEEEK